MYKLSYIEIIIDSRAVVGNNTRASMCPLPVSPQPYSSSNTVTMVTRIRAWMQSIHLAQISSILLVRTQGEDGHLHAQQRHVRRNQPYPRLDLGLPASRTGGNKCLLFEGPGLGCFVIAAQEDPPKRSKGPLSSCIILPMDVQWSRYHLLKRPSFL